MLRVGSFSAVEVFPPARTRDESKVAPKNGSVQGSQIFLGRAHKAVKEGPWVPD